jgi:ribosome modulation factor
VVATKRPTRRAGSNAEDLSLASIHGYIAAQARKARDCCPHADGPLRTAWLGGYEAAIRAMTEWGENVSHALGNRQL